MLITLSGLDGAGKSTLAEALRASLVRDGVPAIVYHINWQLGLYAVLRRGRNALKRLAGYPVPIEPFSKEESAPGRSSLPDWQRRLVWSKGVRRCVDLIDLAGFALYLPFVEKVMGKTLIMDRYFYDRLTDVADGRHWTYLRFFTRLVPVPDVAVLVEVEPSVAFERKGERSIAMMRVRDGHYRIIFGWVPNAVVILNDRLDQAVDELRAVVYDRIQGRRPRHLATER